MNISGADEFIRGDTVFDWPCSIQVPSNVSAVFKTAVLIKLPPGTDAAADLRGPTSEIRARTSLLVVVAAGSLRAEFESSKDVNCNSLATRLLRVIPT